MKGDPPAELDYLLAYYRGVYFATIALKSRLGRLGPEYQPAGRVVAAYQATVKGYWDALKETVAMHRGRDSGSQG